MEDATKPPDTVEVEVTLAFTICLPAEESARAALYGAVDPGECAMIDLEADPVSFLCDTPSRVVGWQLATETREPPATPAPADRVLRGALRAAADLDAACSALLARLLTMSLPEDLRALVSACGSASEDFDTARAAVPS